jgi:hypothetical protein
MSADYSDVHIESHLPKPWEQEPSFDDVLYDWMQRAPWLAISAAAHLLLLIVLNAVPWEQFEPKEPLEIEVRLIPPPAEAFEAPEAEILEEGVDVEPPESLEEPVLAEAEPSAHDEAGIDEEFRTATGDPNFVSDAPFEGAGINDVIGIGGAAGGKYGGRFDGSKELRAAAGRAVEQSLEEALEWLAAHQSPEGYWDCDGFGAMCGEIGDSACGDPGQPTHDVGVTGLALLAFLGDGNTTSKGAHRDVVARGIKWLREQQDPATGLIGASVSRDFIYDHAIATLAMSETYYFSKSPLLKPALQDAVGYIHRARNRYSGWRYDVPPLGDNDTSVTGWCLFALASAKDAGLSVEDDALAGGLAWIDDVTEVRTGRVGYTAKGMLSSRTSLNERWPREKGEAMTAVGLLCRIFLQQDPDKMLLDGEKILYKHADLLLHKLPEWDVEGFGCDMYYWYYGTYAMFQMGGDYWKRWEEAMREAIVPNQRKDGDEKGSWDPVGPWGYAGGRVYSTALMTLCVEVYYRYARILGAR